MKSLFVAIAVAAATLAGSSAANAAGKGAAAKPQMQAGPSTDISAQGRHHHWHGSRHHHWRPYGYSRPYYRSYGYYPRPHVYHGRPYGYYGGHRW